MPLIRETIVTTRNADGSAHIAPIGIIEEGAHWVIAPFKPSTTLDNLRARPCAVANYTDDVTVFAGCLTGRHDWPTAPASEIACDRLAAALAHTELAVERVEEDDLRPRFLCRVVHEASHAPFQGFNRAQWAVIEAAILASRLDFLPRDKIETEIAYLRTVVEKTAGPREQQAWSWVEDKIAAFYRDAADAE